MSTAKSPRSILIACLFGPACSVISGLSDYELADSPPPGMGGAQITGSGGGSSATGAGGAGGGGGACDAGAASGVGGAGGAPIPPVIVSQGPGLGIVIPDDERYDGTIASMTCVTLTVPDLGGSVVSAVELEIGITHAAVGDLVIKVVSPQGTVTTVMSRPGVTDEGDTSFETNGKVTNLAATHPIRFADGQPDPAEDMGSGLGTGDVVCRDDLRCDYGPVADSGPGNGFAEFECEPPVGDWQVCVADGDDTDAGTIGFVQLSILAW